MILVAEIYLHTTEDIVFVLKYVHKWAENFSFSTT